MITPRGFSMLETLEQRWYRWDKLINEGEALQVVNEFDEMVRTKRKIVIGDMVRKDHALEALGIDSLSPFAKQMREEKNEKSKGRKSKA